MPQRDLHYPITGDSASLERASNRGAFALSNLEREARRLERQQQKTHATMTAMGKGMLLAGAAVAAGLALSVRAALDWESAWAGVLKTVDGSPEQMAALEEEIRALTDVLPATHQEIAAVAEAAGQLGIQRENVAAFTKTMIDMGEATNLTSEEAATSIARLMNIMQTAPENVDRLASAIVDLGNKGATTESEITEMALRIAGAGNTIGLTEQQVLGFAAALSNVGIRANAGGTAISRVFLEIDSAVSAGGDNLETFAETAGMTVDEFRQAYERDAGGAIASFVAGLGRVQQTGGDVNAVLADLGLTEIRVSDALRRLAGSGDNLTGSLALSNRAWDQNTALVEEAERRYGTVEARIGIARNQVNDFAIDIGSTLLPIVGDLVDMVGAMADVIGSLPGPVKTALGVLAGLAAAVLLLGGAFLVLVPKVVAGQAALQRVVVAGGRAAVMARGLSAALSFLTGPWGLAIAAAATVATLAFGAMANRQAEARSAAKEFASTLDELTGAITDNSRAFVAHRLLESDAVDAAEQLGLSTSELVDIVLQGEGAMRALDEALGGTGDSYLQSQSALGKLTQQFDESAKAQAVLQGAVKGVSGEVAAGQAVWDALTEAQGSNARQVEDLDPAAQALAGSLNMTAGETESLTAEVESLDKALQALLGIMFGVEEAEDAAATALRRVTDAAKENGTELEGNSEAALTNRDNVRDLIAADFDLVNAMAEAGASAEDLTTETERLKRKFIEQMRQAGFSEEAVEQYAEAYDLIPSEVQTRISTPGMTAAERNARNLKLSLDRIPRRVDINIHQATTASVGSQRIGHQHGGEVVGPPGTDNLPRMLTAGEIVIRRSVAQENRAAILALNQTGRWPVSAMGGAGSTAHEGTRADPVRQALAALPASGGTGDVFLDGRKVGVFVRHSVRHSMQTDPAFRVDVRGGP